MEVLGVRIPLMDGGWLPVQRAAAKPILHEGVRRKATWDPMDHGPDPASTDVPECYARCRAPLREDTVGSETGIRPVGFPIQRGDRHARSSSWNHRMALRKLRGGMCKALSSGAE